jgi:hypothetical protein
VRFERICRENGIVARNTKPRSPTTTGKVERFHQTLQQELLDHVDVWPDLATAQAAIGAFRHEYNTNRPHQSLHMAFPADRFTPRTTDQAPTPQLPATLPPAAAGSHPVAAGTVPPRLSTNGAEPVELAVEFTRVVPSSGNLAVCGQQFWLGPDRAGGTVTFWADTTRRAPAGQRSPPQDRAVAAHHHPPALAPGRRRPSRRAATDPHRHHPRYCDRGGPDRQHRRRHRPRRTASARLRDARPAGLPPQPPAEPVRVERRISCRGALEVAGQRIHVGVVHAGRTVTVEASDTTWRIYHGDELLTEVARTSTKPIARFKVRKLEPPRRKSSAPEIRGSA